MITEKLLSVCTQHQVRCLHGIESGSRAWGFASPDSDYDVRLIYCHDADWYLQLYDGKESFEFIQNDLFDVPFDIGGWDLRKALKLIYKSNAVIFEWLNSPIIYHSDDIVLQQIKAVYLDYFDPRAVCFHYLGMVKNANRSIELNQPLKLKKWFYYLRALLCCVWVIEKQTPPSVNIDGLFSLLNDDEVAQLNAMIRIKQQQNEDYLHHLNDDLQQLSLRLWQHSQQGIASLKHRQGDIKVLDALFKQIIFQA